MSRPVDILIYFEDPGAINMIHGLGSSLSKRYVSFQVIVNHVGQSYAFNRLDSFETISPGTTSEMLLDAYGPKLVVCGTAEDPDTPGLHLIAEAGRRGIPSVGLVDGPSHAAYRFRGTGDDPLGFAPDHVVVPEPLTAGHFRDLGVASDRIFIAGHPDFDRIAAKRTALLAEGKEAIRKRVLPEAPEDRSLVVFLSELSDGIDPKAFQRNASYTLTGRGRTRARTLVVLEEVLDTLATLPSRPFLVLKTHPKDSEKTYQPYRCEIDIFCRDVPLADVCFAADLVIGLTTFGLTEAALIGTPTLSVIPQKSEQDWLAGIGLGLVPSVCQRDMLRQSLQELLVAPATPKQKAAQNMIHYGAADRLAAQLSEWIGT